MDIFLGLKRKRLVGEYTEKEIYATLKELSLLKAPGLDGFQAVFLSKRQGCGGPYRHLLCKEGIKWG